MESEVKSETGEIIDTIITPEDTQEGPIDYEALLAEIRDNSIETAEAESLDTEDYEPDPELDAPQNTNTPGYTTVWAYGMTDEGRSHRIFLEVPTAKAEEEKALAMQKYYAKNKELKRKFANKALTQTDIDLNMVVPDKEMQLLISLLTQDYAKRRDRYLHYVHKSISRLLFAKMPRCVKNAFRYYPQTIRRCPGFMYQATEENGKGLKLWVTPDIPYFFSQGSEMDILLINFGDAIPYIDRAVARYYACEARRVQKEVYFGSRLLTKMPHGTYMDLVKENAIWFNRLYEAIMEVRKKAE